MKQFKQYTLKKINVPDKFVMNPVELKEYIDFDVKRVYYITNVVASTGAHCHKVEREFFILLKGKCVAVVDQGNGLEEVAMNESSNALYVGEYVWHHFKDFSEDAILLALSSTNYISDRSDYIEDYEIFKKISV